MTNSDASGKDIPLFQQTCEINNGLVDVRAKNQMSVRLPLGGLAEHMTNFGACSWHTVLIGWIRNAPPQKWRIEPITFRGPCPQHFPCRALGGCLAPNCRSCQNWTSLLTCEPETTTVLGILFSDILLAFEDLIPTGQLFIGSELGWCSVTSSMISILSVGSSDTRTVHREYSMYKTRDRKNSRSMFSRTSRTEYGYRKPYLPTVTFELYCTP